MTILLLLIIGLSAGLLSGLLGIGGGLVIVPALVYGLGFSPKIAVGTSLAILLPPVGVAAVWEYYKHGNVNLKAACLIAVMLFIGSWFGAQISNHIDSKTVKTLFGTLLVILGVYMIYDSTRII